MQILVFYIMGQVWCSGSGGGGGGGTVTSNIKLTYLGWGRYTAGLSVYSIDLLKKK